MFTSSKFISPGKHFIFRYGGKFPGLIQKLPLLGGGSQFCLKFIAFARFSLPTAAQHASIALFL